VLLGVCRNPISSSKQTVAVQALAAAGELGLDAARANVRGGAIALGQPTGAGGAHPPDSRADLGDVGRPTRRGRARQRRRDGQAVVEALA
jgi:hypothetical protein